MHFFPNDIIQTLENVLVYIVLVLNEMFFFVVL